mgnify:CR=1 FL=1
MLANIKPIPFLNEKEHESVCRCGNELLSLCSQTDKKHLVTFLLLNLKLGLHIIAYCVDNHFEMLYI